MEANEPAYILATSVRPRAEARVAQHGCYQVYVHSMAKWMFGLRPSDACGRLHIGWVSALLHRVRATPRVHAIAYEGAIDPPTRDLLRIIRRTA